MYNQLDLVNACLRAIGNDKVSSLEYADVDTDAALDTVDETVVDVLSIGWWFNTEYWTLTPDDNGEIEVPTTLLGFVIESPGMCAELVVRSGKLYDKTNGTFDLRPVMPTGGLRLKSTISLEITDIPVACQQYIRTRSRVKMMQDMDTDVNKVGLEKAEELRYLSILERHHTKYQKLNSYKSPRVRNVLGSMNSQSNYFGSANPLGKDEC